MKEAYSQEVIETYRLEYFNGDQNTWINLSYTNIPDLKDVQEDMEKLKNKGKKLRILKVYAIKVWEIVDETAEPN